MKESKLPIIGHIPAYLEYCEIEKGLSSKTQENYAKFLRKFSLWLKADNKEDLLPHQLTADDIWGYRVYLSKSLNSKGSGLSKATQNYYLIALRGLMTYFTTKDIMSLPSDKISLPKDVKREKKVKFLTLEQIEKLLLAPDTQTPKGIRDRAILESLFSTGLRIAELVSLNVEQFANLKQKKDLEISVTGKGSHTRTVYFSERALSWIKKYSEIRSNYCTPDDKAMFVHVNSKPSDENRLTSASIERSVKNYAVASGIPLFTTPHTLRHSMATDLLSQGVDLRVIQEFLGHRNISTTQIYTHVTNKRLRDIHRQFHSGKNLKN
jgi:site-specific recombinase XerD